MSESARTKNDSKQETVANGVLFGSAATILATADAAVTRAKETHAREQSVIGAMMREARESVGLGLREMARRLRYTPPYISDLEKGRRAWTIKLIQKYERTLK